MERACPSKYCICRTLPAAVGMEMLSKCNWLLLWLEDLVCNSTQRGRARRQSRIQHLHAPQLLLAHAGCSCKPLLETCCVYSVQLMEAAWLRLKRECWTMWDCFSCFLCIFLLNNCHLLRLISEAFRFTFPWYTFTKQLELLAVSKACLLCRLPP